MGFLPFDGSVGTVLAEMGLPTAFQLYKALELRDGD